MRYKTFRIRNFKGIKDATVDLSSMTGANVFTLVGLNESGKTTILEALHSFSPDYSSGRIINNNKHSDQKIVQSRVPRHLISTFSGDISVSAVVILSHDDKVEWVKYITSDYDDDLHLDIDSIPDEITVERSQTFIRGDFKDSGIRAYGDFRVKSAKQRKWRNPTDKELNYLSGSLHDKCPDIAYFPTFIFDFPERIYLTNRGTTVSRFYKQVFQDILDFDGQGHKIEEDIVRRVRQDDLIIPWLEFLNKWTAKDDRVKIQHVIDRAASTVTKLVFGRWNKIFKEDAKGKEVSIIFDTTEGQLTDKAGAITKTNNHDVFIQFQIRDGTRRFNVNDRSLGFRWFFAFLLFTQFRVARANSRPVLFLFDEPASNLHAAAQQKLIESFPEIARGDHMLMYTTHSHYMVEPAWLEQTFIVSNRSDTPADSVIEMASLDEESLDISIERYRNFANHHSNQTSYFQPVIDRLEVVPSKFDQFRPAIVVEGKSDYYILRYAMKLHGSEEIPMVPGLGAGTFSALVALGVGWGIDFLFLLDGDEKGKDEAKRYALEYGAPIKGIATLDECVSDLKVIEDLLDDIAMSKISQISSLTTKPTKNQIRRYFQETLASGNVVDLGDAFRQRSKAALDALRERLRQVADQ